MKPFRRRQRLCLCERFLPTGRRAVRVMAWNIMSLALLQSVCWADAAIPCVSSHIAMSRTVPLRGHAGHAGVQASPGWGPSSRWSVAAPWRFSATDDEGDGPDLLAADNRTWYVRPEGGRYGREDGTSYGDAWNGLRSVVWGPEGVAPGDTLYVCGLHLRVLHTTDPPSSSAIYPVAGLSETERTTIRGDYPGDPGIVWGAAGVLHEAWKRESDVLWSIRIPGSCYIDWFFQDISADAWIVLDRTGSVEEATRSPGSFFYAGQREDRLYVHLTDSGDPTGRVYINKFGYWFDMDGTHHVTFRDLKLYNHTRFCQRFWVVSDIEWNGCTVFYGDHFLLKFFDHQHRMSIINCEIGWAGNGIYLISTTDDSPRDFVVRGNYIHDIGVRPSSQNSDAHAFGAQGLRNALIEDNVCENTGTGISFYAWTDQEAKDNTIRRNIVRNTHLLGGANSRGIETMCDNDSLSDKSGNIFYQNIVVNAEMGYRFTHEDTQMVYNNVASQCNIGFAFVRRYLGYGPRVRLRNNIVHKSRERHLLFLSSCSTDCMLDSDYNLFYPDGPALFKVNNEEGDLRGWRAFVERPFVYDPHSRAVDPSFVDPDKLDFRLRPDSPCIDAGIDVGLHADFEGGRVPEGMGPDIGPYEYAFVADE